VKLIGELLALINRLLDFVVEVQSRREDEAAQREREAIHRDPADWLSQHFGLPAESGKKASGSDSSSH
jgi:hypothetical protein